MATIATIQLPEGDQRVIKIKPGDHVEKTFTVSNIYGSQLRIGFQCQFDKPEQKKWAKPKEPVERDFGDQGSEQVKLEIQIPKDAVPGKYNLKLLVYSLKDPNLDFTLSDPIVVEVTAVDAIAPKPKQIWPWIVAGVTTLLIIGVVTWILLPTNVIIPNLVGKPIDEVTTLLEGKKIPLGEVTEERTGKAQVGEVLSQSPAADTTVKKSDLKPIKLVVEIFSVGVPDVKGMTVTQAQHEFKLNGLKLGAVNEQKTGSAPGGTVLKTDPEIGTRVAPDAEIMLSVETQSVIIPSVAGQLLTQAKPVLEGLGLMVQVELVKTGAQGLHVLSTRPVSATAVKPGSTVVLVVEKQMLSIPNFSGQNLDSVVNQLNNMNLRLGAVRRVFVIGRPTNTVLSHIPAAGASVDPLTPLTFIVTQGSSTIYPYKAVISPTFNMKSINTLGVIRREVAPLVAPEKQ